MAAVAAVAADLHAHPTTGGLLRFAALFVPIWWAWMGFTWYATAFDSDDAPFRLAMLAAMLAVIALAANVDGVRRGHSIAFAAAYGAMFVLLAAMYARAWRNAPEARPLTARYGLGDALGAAIWLASIAVEPPARYWVWGAAMLVMLAAPVVAVRSLEAQSYDSTHIPERYGLFTLIVLGESIVAVVGGIEHGGRASVALTAAAGFAIAACIWWVYFERVGSSALSREHLFPAFVWGYGHLLVFAGIAAAADGVRLAADAAAHGESVAATGRAALCGGLAAYFVATATIEAVTARRPNAVVGLRLGAAGSLVVLALVSSSFPPLLLAGTALAFVLAASLADLAMAEPSR